MATDRCEMHCNLLLNILNLGMIFSLCHQPFSYANTHCFPNRGPEKCLLRLTLPY